MSKLPVFEELLTETAFLGSVIQVAGGKVAEEARVQGPVTGVQSADSRGR